MKEAIVYFVIDGLEAFDISNPDWKRVRILTLWDRLDTPSKRLVDASLANGVAIKSMNPIAQDSIDQYITGRNY
jgi:hypothetical protein